MRSKDKDHKGRKRKPRRDGPEPVAEEHVPVNTLRFFNQATGKERLVYRCRTHTDPWHRRLGMVLFGPDSGRSDV